MITPTLAKVAEAPKTFRQKLKWKPLGQESSSWGRRRQTQEWNVRDAMLEEAVGPRTA